MLQYETSYKTLQPIEPEIWPKYFLDLDLEVDLDLGLDLGGQKFIVLFIRYNMRLVTRLYNL